MGTALCSAAVAISSSALVSTVPDDPLWALRTWLDSWSGIGHVAVRDRAPGR
jgi:hypothetical protein